jgi:hypothetical protein
LGALGFLDFVYTSGFLFWEKLLFQRMETSASWERQHGYPRGCQYRSSLLFSVFTTLFPEYWHHRGLHAHIYFEASAIVIVFVLIGKLLEENAKSNTSSAIKKLIGLQPNTVWIIVNGEEQQIPIDEVRVEIELWLSQGNVLPWTESPIRT